MNSLFTLVIFFCLLFAFCTPSQGQAIAVSNVAFENGERYGVTYLIRLPDGSYKIKGCDATFRIEGIDTIVGKDIVLRTTDKSYVQLELVNSRDSQQLFDMTTRSKLGERVYSLQVSIYKYKEGLLLEDVLLSGFEYSTTGEPQPRFVVHSGEPLAAELVPHLLWTGGQFNYHAWFNSVILILRTKPADEKNEYYLVNFRNATNIKSWMFGYSRSYTKDVGNYSNDVYNYFNELMRDNYFK